MTVPVFDHGNFSEENTLERKRLRKVPDREWRNGYRIGYEDGRNRCIREYQE